MKREDCEKLLAAYRESVIAGNGSACQMLFEVIVGIMADDKPVYRDGGIVVGNKPLVDWSTTTTPVHVTKPVITCDGQGEITEHFRKLAGLDD